MVVVGEYQVQQTGFRRRVKINRNVIGCKSQLGRFLERYSKRLVVLRVHGHIRRDDIVKQARIKIPVAIIHQDKVGMLVYLVEHMRVIH